MRKMTSLSLVMLFLFSSLSGCLTPVITDESSDKIYFDEVNQIWDAYDYHPYTKRSTSNATGYDSIAISNNLISNNEIFLLNYWEPYIFKEGELKWSENPYEDNTWKFYFHSLRMVSYLMNAYETTGNITYLDKAEWFIDSWIEHNPTPEEQASTSAWSDHSTANRISTFIYFWDYYRDSDIFDVDFAKRFLNILSMHGEYTANDENYTWYSNHGIYQDRALMQLAILFPNFEQSNEWLLTSFSRLSHHIENDLTPSGVSKEHSPSYHYLVMDLFITISHFANYYLINDEKLDFTIELMQEYLVYITKPDGTIPMVGDSTAWNVVDKLRLSGIEISNEHLLYLVSDGLEGKENSQNSIVYQDAGVAVFKNDWKQVNPIYFALFNGFHSTVHKHGDDLSFVLTCQQTDYFVDSGKYNYDGDDPYRVFARSVFAHNSIAVDDKDYDVRNAHNIGKSIIEKYVITSNYSYVKGSHTLYDGVKITRSVIFFNDGAIYFHDSIESNDSHTYTQIFNVGKDVHIDDTDTNNVSLSSMIDNSSLTLTQLIEVSEYQSYTGSEDPIRGWQSTSFNQVSPITTLNFQQEGKDITFETVINIGLHIIGVDYFQEESKDIFVFTFESGRTERIEII